MKIQNTLISIAFASFLCSCESVKSLEWLVVDHNNVPLDSVLVSDNLKNQRIFTDFTCQIRISYKYILHSTTAYYNPAKYVFNASTYFIMALRPVSVILQIVRGFTPEPSVVFDI